MPDYEFDIVDKYDAIDDPALRPELLDALGRTHPHIDISTRSGAFAMQGDRRRTTPRRRTSRRHLCATGNPSATTRRVHPVTPG